MFKIQRMGRINLATWTLLYYFETNWLLDNIFNVIVCQKCRINVIYYQVDGILTKLRVMYMEYSFI